MGTKGRVLVDSSLLLTQFGFCVGYFIFLGNTLHALTENRLALDVSRYQDDCTTLAPNTAYSTMELATM